jgi:hypothetical protein
MQYFQTVSEPPVCELIQEYKGLFLGECNSSAAQDLRGNKKVCTTFANFLRVA